MLSRPRARSFESSRPIHPRSLRASARGPCAAAVAALSRRPFSPSHRGRRRQQSRALRLRFGETGLVRFDGIRAGGRCWARMDDAARPPAVLPAGVGSAAALQRIRSRARGGRLCGRTAHPKQRRHGLARKREKEASVSIAERLATVHARIERAAVAARRDPAGVELVAVSQAHPVESIRQAYAAGQRAFGESYAQELEAKAQTLADLPGLVWHFVGHLQTNKAKIAAKYARVVHSVDSAALAPDLGNPPPPH